MVASAALTPACARAISCRVSGATEKDIYEWKLDYDDGRPEYEGKIIYGGMEYEFTINAVSPDFSVSVTTAVQAFSAASASFFVKPDFSAIAATNSFLFIWILLFLLIAA